MLGLSALTSPWHSSVITVIDYGLGNRASILNMLGRLGIPARLGGSAGEVAAAKRLILPGVGAFDCGMTSLRERGLIEPIQDAVRRKIPILGICLGMQLMGDGSEEGGMPGLGLVRARCLKFVSTDMKPIRIPHMGWTEPDIVRRSRLWDDEPRPRYYFVHSYYMACEDQSIITAQVDYGARFTAAFEFGDVFGVQFHPEKSHRFGMRLLTAFASA